MRAGLLLILTLLLAAPAPAAMAGPKVVADIAPVHSLVAMLTDGLDPAPGLLLPPGASPHSHALRPSDARALAAADLVVWVGPDLTPWLGRSIETLAPDAQVLVLEYLPGTATLPLRTGPDLSGQVAGSIDPHLWLSPDNARAWLGAIADALGRLDPANAGRYAANASAARAGIDAAQARARALLGAGAPPPFLTTHDSFQYFERAFGLQAAGALREGDAARPNPARLLALRRLVTGRNIACLLAEPPVETGLIGAVFDTRPVRIAITDPAGATLAPGPELYPALIEALARALASCAQGQQASARQSSGRANRANALEIRRQPA